jgi:hypothetical protein
MSEDKNKPATIGDLERTVTASEHRLIEAMRDSETRLLGAFHG